VAATQSEGAGTELAEQAKAGPKRGEGEPSREGTGKEPRLSSVRELCRLPTDDKDEPFQAQEVGD
ncbi:unnamed protein product, partial [Musa textilis]